MRKIFEKYTFWAMMGLSIFSLLITFFQVNQTNNLNRSIGWGWDLTNMLRWIMPSISSSIILFTLGYALFLLKKRETHFLLSLLQVLVLIILLPTSNITLSVVLLLVSWFIFTINMIISNAK